MNAASLITLVLAAAVLAYSLWPRRREGGAAPSAGPMLAQFTRDLTEAAGKGAIEPVVGREKEIARTIEILSRKTKNNPLLLGEPGVGKTAIAEGLALRIVRGDVPDELKSKRVLALDLTGLISDTKYRGEFEKRVKGLLTELAAAHRHIILFIDEVHTLAQAKGAEGSLNVSDIFKPALARGDLMVIGATTPEEYEQYLRHDETLDRRFQAILVPEPTPAETLTILQGIRPVYENYHRVRYTDEALKSAIELSGEFARKRFLPDRAIDLIDEAGARVKIRASGAASHAVGLMHEAGERARGDRQGAAEGSPQVTAEDIRKIVEEWKGA